MENRSKPSRHDDGIPTSAHLVSTGTTSHRHDVARKWHLSGAFWRG